MPLVCQIIEQFTISFASTTSPPLRDYQPIKHQTAKMLALQTAQLLFLSLSVFTLASPEPQVGTRVTVNPAQASTILSRLSTYEAALTQAPQFTSVMSVLETAIPDDAKSELAGEIGAFLSSDGEEQGGVITTRSWYTALPSEVKNYMASVESAQKAFITATGNAAAPTGVNRAVAGMGAGLAGVVGVALML